MPPKSLILIMILALGLSGCSDMKLSDFANVQPSLKIEEYFQGKTRAWGIFEDRFGNVRRQFTVDITGVMRDGVLTLDEQFLYADGERDQRIWTISKTGSNTYEGRADDIIGTATGEVRGNALNWRYHMNLAMGGTRLKVHFDDWMFLQPGGVLLNRARVSKFGIEIGEVTLSFQKVEDPTSREKLSRVSAGPSETVFAAAPNR